jgi:hypothetical protein
MASAYGIDIEGPDTHQQKVQGVLQQIASNPVGGVILVAMAGTGKDATIVPFDKGKQAITSECNAGALPDDPRDAAPEGVRGGQPGAPWFRGNPKQPWDQLPWKAGRGTGKGSDVHVYFSPETSEKTRCVGKGPGSQADETLVHELVHALRMMQGRFNAYPTEDGLAGYDTEEEFLAIVVANVYMSSKGSQELRADHHGTRPLMPPLTTSSGFLAHPGNKHVMKIYQLVWQPVFRELARVRTAPFNPFRQLEADLARHR